MAKTRKMDRDNPVVKGKRERTFKTESVLYVIIATEKSSGQEKELATAKTAPAAMATFQLARSMGQKTHEEFFIRKIARVVPLSNGELTA